MGGCVAPNCSSHSRKSVKMHRFPVDSDRRRVWTINCGRTDWVPNKYSELCYVHFDESQYEQNRADNVKKLKPNAVPTLFECVNLPDAPVITCRALKEEECISSSVTLIDPEVDSIQVHFEENQFELHRQDGWKKLKPNAIPTIFPEPTEAPKKRERSSVSRKRKSPPGEESGSVISKKKSKKGFDTPLKKRKLIIRKKIIKSKIVPKKKHSSTENSPNDTVLKKKGGSEGTANSQKENVSPRKRKLKRPLRAATPESDSATEEEYEHYIEAVSEDEDEEDSELEAAQQQIAQLKQENESMKQEIAEFEKHNKAMARVILELEKHNKLMSLKLTELDKDNKVLNKKVSDLERLNEDLKSKLNCCFSEEQFARMEKMRQLGTIERYIPALK